MGRFEQRKKICEHTSTCLVKECENQLILAKYER